MNKSKLVAEEFDAEDFIAKNRKKEFEIINNNNNNNNNIKR